MITMKYTSSEVHKRTAACRSTIDLEVLSATRNIKRYLTTS